MSYRENRFTQIIQLPNRNPTIMAFSASTAFVGSPDFNVIDINAEEVAKALQVYLERGSKLTGVSLDDINTSVTKMPADSKKATLTDLLECGMKLFDAIIWLSAGRPSSRELQVDPTMTKESLPSLHEIARSVFYVYFFLLTQARYPAGSKTTEKPRVPNFLKVIMGMELDQNVYVDRICSFEPQKFDPAWIKFVNFKNFGQETISRFGLGVAGYRLFGPFKLYKVKEGLSSDLTEAVKFAQTVATSAATWDIHPSTRNPAILTKRGNINKNLGNLKATLGRSSSSRMKMDCRDFGTSAVTRKSGRSLTPTAVGAIVYELSTNLTVRFEKSKLSKSSKGEERIGRMKQGFLN